MALDQSQREGQVIQHHFCASGISSVARYCRVAHHLAVAAGRAGAVLISHPGMTWWGLPDAFTGSITAFRIAGDKRAA
jgi:hypothetical protein